MAVPGRRKMPAMARGRFITFEGGEGAGKSTQVAALAAHLQHVGIEAVTTREPGGSPGAEEIRKLLVTGTADRWDPMTEALLHYAARRCHLLAKVLPALEDGKWVLSDRYADSTLAYQGYGHQLGERIIQELHKQALGDLGLAAVQPDLTFILDLPVAEGLARAADRRGEETRYESMATAFHERLRDGFLAIAESDPQRCVVIDAAADANSVKDAIEIALTARLGAVLP